MRLRKEKPAARASHPRKMARRRNPLAKKIMRSPRVTAPSLPSVSASGFKELSMRGADGELPKDELQRAQAQAEDLQQRYFRHFDLAPMGMIRLNSHGIILEANILGAAMLGIERNPVANNNLAFADFVTPESREILQAHLEDALALSSPLAVRRMETCELTLRGLGKAGKFIRMQTVVSAGENGARDLLVTLTDLSEHQKLEGGLARLKNIAEAAVRAKDVSLAMLSHELRTPLTPVLMLLKELEESPNLSPSDRSTLAAAIRNLKLEVRLIDDLLDLTRTSQGKLALKRGVTDAHLVLNRVLEDAKVGFGEKELALEVDLAAAQRMVVADPARLQQIVSNLLRNALKFTGPGGRLAIRSFNPAPGRIALEFTDTGIGIEPDALPHIFAPFVQAGPSIQTRFGGLGLGLAISKSLAEAHDGCLTASSPGLGKGATFRLELPAFERRARPTAIPPVKAPDLPRRRNLRLLLVENHPDTLLTLQRLLGRKGYVVEIACDFASALALCSATRFDLIISDVGLPDRSGLELMQEIKRRRQIPGVAVSGFGLDTDVAKSLAAGFSEHLIKPIDFEQLDITLQRLAAVEP
jgi:signal transduction histidine kinase